MIGGNDGNDRHKHRRLAGVVLDLLTDSLSAAGRTGRDHPAVEHQLTTSGATLILYSEAPVADAPAAWQRQNRRVQWLVHL